MIHMLLQALFGLVVGIVAHWFVAGPHGLIVTPLTGLAGGWVGGRLAGLFGWKQEGSLMSFVMAVVGAILLIVAYNMVMNH